MFLSFLPFFFLPERILSKVKSLALQLISWEERCPCYFHQQWARVGYGRGAACAGRCDQWGCCTSFCEWEAFFSSERGQLFMNEDLWSSAACRTYQNASGLRLCQNKWWRSEEVSCHGYKNASFLSEALCNRFPFPRKCVCLFVYLFIYQFVSLPAGFLLEASLIRLISSDSFTEYWTTGLWLLAKQHWVELVFLFMNYRK